MWESWTYTGGCFKAWELPHAKATKGQEEATARTEGIGEAAVKPDPQGTREGTERIERKEGKPCEPKHKAV